MLNPYMNELREEILKEYELGVYGYRLLAKLTEENREVKLGQGVREALKK